MRKVKSDFFCIKTKVSYKAGDVYNGDRTDLDHVLEPVKKEKKERKPRTKKAEKYGIF